MHTHSKVKDDECKKMKQDDIQIKVLPLRSTNTGSDFSALPVTLTSWNNWLNFFLL